ncbi:MAG: TolC family protein [Deltaproteobacteria bacterium]|nr:TolC family protein [Deltaproteobacteria bacterium]
MRLFLAIQVALDAHPTILISKERVFEIKYNADEVWLDFLPFFGLETKHSHFENENLFDAGIRLRYPLFEGGRVYYGYQEQIEKGHAANLEVRILEQDLIKNVKVAYINILLYEWLLKAHQTLKNQLSSLHELTVNLIKNGLVSRPNLLRVKTQLLKAETSITDYEKYVEIAKSVLLNLLNREQTQSIEVENRLEHFISKDFSLAAVLDLAFEGRSEFDLYDRELAALDHAVDKANSVYWPRITADAIYGGANYPMGYSGSGNRRMGNFEQFWGVGLSIELDFFSWAKAHKQSSQLESQKKQVELKEREFINDLALEVKKSYLTWKAAQVNLKISKELSSTAKQTYDEILADYKTGKELSEAVLETLEAVIESRKDYLKAFYDVYIAEAVLEREAGMIH